MFLMDRTYHFTPYLLQSHQHDDCEYEEQEVHTGQRDVQQERQVAQGGTVAWA